MTVKLGKGIVFGGVPVEPLAQRLVLPAGAVRAKIRARENEFVTVAVLFASGVVQSYYLADPPNDNDKVCLWDPQQAILASESGIVEPHFRHGRFTVSRPYWNQLATDPGSAEARVLFHILAHIRNMKVSTNDEDGVLTVEGESPFFPPAKAGEPPLCNAVLKKSYGTDEDGEECYTVEFAGFVPVDQPPEVGP